MRNIIFCEGKNDVYFLHETFINILNMTKNEVYIYKNQHKLNNDIRSERVFRISLLQIMGYPNCCKLPILFSRYFWSDKILLKIGVVNDRDSGIAYDKLKLYSNSYLNNPNRVNRLKPIASYDDANRIINYKFNNRSDINIWNLLVIKSLEDNMYKILKKNHVDLKDYNEQSLVFAEAKELLNLNQEELVRYCTNLFIDEPWYRNFHNTLGNRI